MIEANRFARRPSSAWTSRNSATYKRREGFWGPVLRKSTDSVTLCVCVCVWLPLRRPKPAHFHGEDHSAMDLSTFSCGIEQCLMNKVADNFSPGLYIFAGKGLKTWSARQESTLAGTRIEEDCRGIGCPECYQDTLIASSQLASRVDTAVPAAATAVTLSYHI